MKTNIYTYYIYIYIYGKFISILVFIKIETWLQCSNPLER